MTKTKQEYLERKRAYNQLPHVKAQRKAYKEEYYKKKKDALLSQQREYYSIPENRAKKLYGKTKERALKAGIEFNIDVEDIVIPTHCPYLGFELTHYLGKGHVDTNSSIDRIDSSKGYIKGNIQVISLLANQMKNSATKEQLIKFSKSILELYE